MSNAPGMVAGYGNLDDYLPDDTLPDFLKVDGHRYEYGKPLVKDEKSLTTMMRRFHNWYMETWILIFIIAQHPSKFNLTFHVMGRTQHRFLT